MDNNRANQMNSNNSAYWSSRGHEERPSDWSSAASAGQGGNSYSKSDMDNHSNQLNPNNDTYYSSRGTSKK